MPYYGHMRQYQSLAVSPSGWASTTRTTGPLLLGAGAYDTVGSGAVSCTSSIFRCSVCLYICILGHILYTFLDIKCSLYYLCAVKDCTPAAMRGVAGTRDDVICCVIISKELDSSKKLGLPGRMGCREPASCPHINCCCRCTWWAAWPASWAPGLQARCLSDEIRESRASGS